MTLRNNQTQTSQHGEQQQGDSKPDQTINALFHVCRVLPQKVKHPDAVGNGTGQVHIGQGGHDPGSWRVRPRQEKQAFQRSLPAPVSYSISLYATGCCEKFVNDEAELLLQLLDLVGRQLVPMLVEQCRNNSCSSIYVRHPQRASRQTYTGSNNRHDGCTDHQQRLHPELHSAPPATCSPILPSGRQGHARRQRYHYRSRHSLSGVQSAICLKSRSVDSITRS